MTTAPPVLTVADFATESIAVDQLAQAGYVIVPNFLAREHCQQLYDYALNLPAQGWQQAGIGRADNYTTNSAVRQDKIRWLRADYHYENAYLRMMDQLRLELNRELFMGLFDYECHLAHYPPGAFYRKHLDAFKGRSNRILTTVFYLNPDWQEQDGGQLVIYGERGEVLETVLPEAGKLVVFLSDVFVHEVLPGARDRFSITGWYRLNTSIGGVVDPTR
ncbi:2OG-Fe(II) oxygenase [Pseudidiomarina terrestris]|uniref:2OG-Fe(II) oxygenase n=1 Tax=Pseudidiomarina terrestris TaxID=2820060 RepID=A0AAW7R2Z5_9GAMM|nr:MULTISPECIES: 2OG-Fe(II) oxygenase [unclassified Pseudidiomarina]MDN7125580.1 2OG-Fe(II) oxygenase [Pseudidiomarina sp. 1APP75-32.1]MDN7130557.1 2OG-Fe(II) oxygenase [Pseudidiomarina sp. 1APR75-15]MDN7134198.1 2OG-Fe(II) oxygenase [Pseudidiomarina sp. 1ASP75-5]MEA3588374.1 2OG-Fe(II) oxygenase [Pseudidiomarina sp. 1APP75-27a]